MQEYTVLPELDLSPRAFWEECQQEAQKYKADAMLTYMRLLIEKIEAHHTHLDKKKLRHLAMSIRYFPGVESWFDRINQHVHGVSAGKVKVRHYIISAGLKEILEGITIRKHFEKMYASEYYFDHHDAARFPTVVINDTSKTQYIFRINKGVEDITRSINEYMPEGERPIPFENMLYIGDGLTDVPCMTVTKNYGGFALAVYKPRNPESLEVCRKLARADRIDYYAPADYRPGKTLERRVKLILNLITARIMFHKEQFSFRREMNHP